MQTVIFAANAFLLNVKGVPLKGYCIHSNLGALGTVSNARGLDRQIEILKCMG